MAAPDAITATLLENGHAIVDGFREHRPHATEAAIGLIVGGLAPMAGYLLADWSAGSTVAAVMFNLCLANIDRSLGLLEGRDEEMDRHTARWVWACAAYRSGRSRRLPARHFKRERFQGDEFVIPLFAMLCAIIMVPLYVKMTGSDWHVSEIFGGTVLAFAFYFGTGLLGRGRGGRSTVHAHDGSLAEAYIALVGGYTSLLVPAIAQGEVSAEAMIALATLVVIPMVGLGVLRLFDLDRKGELSDWITDWLQRQTSTADGEAAPS